MSNEKHIHPEGIPGFEYTDFLGDKIFLYPYFSMYVDNSNLFVGFEHYDEEWKCWEPYCDATVNITGLPYLFSTIDTNDNGNKILDFLETNGFGERFGQSIPSGYCMYPVFLFNEDKIKEIDPNFYEEYAKAHGREPKESFKNKVANAKIKATESSSAVKDKDKYREK